MKQFLVIFTLLLITILFTACAGKNGAPGTPGLQGNQGPRGNTGPQGPTGSDAASVTAVPLCPGDSSYGTFVEVAYCINNNLYATYSANGGFSTVLVPGTYVSNGINSSCYFTVVSGCTITH